MPDFKIAAKWTVKLPAQLAQIALGDFTGDGKADFMLGGSYFPTQDLGVPLQIFKSTGDGSFSDVTNQTINGVATSIWGRQTLVADFNGDGKSDFFIADNGMDDLPFPGGQNQLLLSSANGLVKATANLPQQKDFTHSATYADVNGDGALDIITGNAGYQSPRPGVLINNGAGVFTEKPNAITGPRKGLEGWTWVALDANGDGLMDLFAAGRSTEPSQILYGDGKGNFRDSGIVLPARPAGFEEVDSIAIDLNGDGRTDLLTSSYNHDSFNGIYTRALIQQADGSFTDETAQRIPGNDLTSKSWRVRTYLADFDGDGDLDALISYAAYPKAPEIWINNNGVFTAEPVKFDSADYVSVATGDINGDGAPDILGLSRQGAVEVLLNTSTAASFVGNDLNDSYVGTPTANIIKLGGGNDVTVGGGGNDAIDGGKGVDTALYSGTRSQYVVTSKNGVTTVRDLVSGRDGTDTLTNVETLKFTDKTLADPSTLNPIGVAIADQLAVDYLGRGVSADWRNATASVVANGASDAVQKSFFAAAVADRAFGANDSVQTIVEKTFQNIFGVSASTFEKDAWAATVAGGYVSKEGLPWAMFNSYLGATNVPPEYQIPAQSRIIAVNAFTNAVNGATDASLGGPGVATAEAARAWLKPIRSQADAAGKVLAADSSVASLSAANSGFITDYADQSLPIAGVSALI